ncbi:hypothetical protein [Hahella ganghwensis]|uniref:hypothetical protein n=1 Tax=Hahella ganghwensis TaxID=286420 RepID=UPI00037EBED3|nr:hypothetical protein [Hahella ganghwensis]
MMKARGIKPLSLDDLEGLTTERLLAYLRKLHECEESLELSDWAPEEIKSIEGIVFKASQEWKEQHALVKRVLAGRPNVS